MRGETSDLTYDKIDASLGQIREETQEVKVETVPATLDDVLAELREINQTIKNTRASLLLANERAHTDVQSLKRMVYDVWRSCWFQCPFFFCFGTA